MGCISARDLSDEEGNLTRVESQLGFGSSHAFRHDAILRKYAHTGDLNDNQFSDAVSVLGLSTKNRAGLENVEAFFKLFTKREKYRLKSLLMLSLLLGQGGVHEKATLLFEIGDTDATHTLTDSIFDKLMLKLFKVAVDLLPQLSVKNTMTKECQYIDHLKLAKLKFVEEVRKIIFNKEVTIEKAKFVKVFETNDTLKTLLTSHGFRTYVHKVYKLHPAPWNVGSVKPAGQTFSKPNAPVKPSTEASGQQPTDVVSEPISSSAPAQSQKSVGAKPDAGPKSSDSKEPSASQAAKGDSAKSQPEPEAKAKSEEAKA